MQKDDPFRTATIQWFSESDIDELTDVWEASVRKTHDFLNEHEILLYRQAVHDRYLVTLSPFGIRIGKTIAAFCAVQDETIEMLFVAPEHQGLAQLNRNFTPQAMEQNLPIISRSWLIG